uniref:Bestrophin homolog n=1 Tax=Parastrongyloides trichosuri TaxID=131310 RepID=A0A0N5A3W2_PARTI
MTVAYMHNIGNAGFRNIMKVLLRWRGSVWKAVIAEFMIWTIIYTILSVIYRVVLSPEQKLIFESVSLICREYGDFIPLTFMLGSFVTTIMTRWTKTFTTIPWSDAFSLYLAAYLEGTDERSVLMRRCVVRQVVTLQAMVFRLVSPRVKNRFPSFDQFIEAGLVTSDEREQMNNDMCFHLPVRWAFQIVMQARKEGRIKSDQAVQDLFKVINDFRARCINVFLIDFMPIPLSYTQVVLLTVRIYFIIAIMGRQFHTNESPRSPTAIDLYVPFLTMFQFIFYVGWAKVAEALLNPFGADDDDFELNWIWERNLKVGLSTIESSDNYAPPLCRDSLFKGDDFDLGELLVTHGSKYGGSEPLIGSAVLDAIGGEGRISVLSRRRSLYPDNYYDSNSDQANMLPNMKQTMRQRLASVVSNLTLNSTKAVSSINMKEKSQKFKAMALTIGEEECSPTASYAKMGDDYEGKCIVNPCFSQELSNYSSPKSYRKDKINDGYIDDNDSSYSGVVGIDNNGVIKTKLSKSNDIIIDIISTNDSDSCPPSRETLSQKNSYHAPSINSSVSNVPENSLIISQCRNKRTNKPYIVLSLPKSKKRNDKKYFEKFKKFKGNINSKSIKKEENDGCEKGGVKNISNINIGASSIEDEYDNVDHIKF